MTKRYLNDILTVKEEVRNLEIYERIKILRNELNLTQTEFGEKIGLKQNTIGQIENGLRGVTDRSILLICQTFHASEEWLRNGTGEMFAESDESILTELTKEYNLDGTQRLIIESVLRMNDLERRALKTFLHNLVDSALSEENYVEFRDGYIKENAAPMAARDGNISGIAEAAALYDAAIAAEEEGKGEN
nr:MAG TPA: helix-turn-helix domain protein [Caudoviricetes sp.]